jgi:hypothetical protein
MQQGAPLANECLRFWRNDQYVYRSGAANSAGQLQSQPTLYGSDGLDAHRMRTTRNMILDVVAQETSACTQRVPGYDITPSTTDNADIGAAALSKKVADYGYDSGASGTRPSVSWSTRRSRAKGSRGRSSTTRSARPSRHGRLHGRRQRPRVRPQSGHVGAGRPVRGLPLARRRVRRADRPRQGDARLSRRGAQGGHRRERRPTRRSMPRRRTSCASRTTWSARARSTAGPAHRHRVRPADRPGDVLPVRPEGQGRRGRVRR